MKKSFIYKVLLLFLFSYSTINSQTFGFGCLGLSGFYGGYGVYTYSAEGLNKSIPIRFTSLSSDEDIKFKQATGFRFGVNVLRANFGEVFLTTKAYYQFSKESKATSFSVSNNTTDLDFELSTNHWGIGIDFGVPVFSIVDLKIVEGGVSFYQVEYKVKANIVDGETTEETFKNDGTDIGYYIGSGLILNLIEGYVSIEGTAMYHFLTVDKLESDAGTIYPLNSVNKSFIDKGGFAATVQLNVGFPL